ncbi:MAG: DUF494 family protein [Nitrospiraceae bacterium]|nr:DUF494 family protein [Nitrospiraceae bacterium]
MKHTLIELVDVIMQRIQERPDARPTEHGMRSWLARQGYNKREIDAAIKLVGPRLAESDNAVDRGPVSVRTLSLYEEYKLSPEARRALVRLELHGLLDTYERESLLDYLNQYDGVVGLAELDYLLTWMVCGNRDVAFQQAFFNVFEGKGDTLH